MTDDVARILLVDDHPIVRDGLMARISNEADLTVCGEAEDVNDTLKLVDELKPDLVIVDISLKTGHGIDLVKRLLKHHPQLKILVHSMYEEVVYAERALQAGALGYLNKQNSRENLIQAVRTILAGNTYVSPEMTTRIVNNRVGGRAATVGKSTVESLSNRELEVFTLIGEAQTNAAIAKQLHISIHTVDTYREKLKSKLNQANSSELNRFAVQWVLENS
jgi:DNA-binding NarL/FixJ family response regulator